MRETYHFIGLGGIGMSALARILMQKGAKVQGTDCSPSLLLTQLEKEGAQVQVGHDAGWVQQATTVVFGSDIKEENEEFARAKELSLPLDAQLKVLKRAKEKMEAAPHTYYLCGCIACALYDFDLYGNCEDPIPVFCRENAILYGNARDSYLYWWPLTIAGKEDRLKFLDWCISQVELQIKYETQKNKRFYRKWFK